MHTSVLELVNRANRHGWICSGYSWLGNTAYIAMTLEKSGLEKGGREFTLFIHPVTGRVFSSGKKKRRNSI